MSFPRSILFLTATAGVLTACDSVPTAPENVTARDRGIAMTISTDPAFDPALVSYNSASCTLQDASTGSVACSYDLGNPTGQSRDIYPGAYLRVSYDCVNPKNGRIASSASIEQSVYTWRLAVTETSISATDDPLPAPYIPANNYTGKDKKYNACKGSNVVSVTDISMLYWEIWIDNWYSGQPGADYRWSCYASDDRFGCVTAD